MDDGSTSIWNYLHITGLIYGLCVGAGMIVGMAVAHHWYPVRAFYHLQCDCPAASQEPPGFLMPRFESPSKDNNAILTALLFGCVSWLGVKTH